MLTNTKFSEKQIDRMNLTWEEFNELKAAAYRTWQAIGSDCEMCNNGKSLSMSAMVEVTIDADHMLSYGGDHVNHMDQNLYNKFKALPYSTMKKIVREALGVF